MILTHSACFLSNSHICSAVFVQLIGFLADSCKNRKKNKTASARAANCEKYSVYIYIFNLHSYFKSTIFFSFYNYDSNNYNY